MPNPDYVLDTIVQGAAVALLHTYKVAAAPIPRTKTMPDMQPADLGSAISFSAPSAKGTLLLLLPELVFSLARPDGVSSYRASDWIRELSNQLMGRIKNRLLPYSIKLQPGLPILIDRVLMGQYRRDAPLAVYGFRTLRGQFQVILLGQIDYSGWVYTGQHPVMEEAEMALF